MQALYPTRRGRHGATESPDTFAIILIFFDRGFHGDSNSQSAIGGIFYAFLLQGDWSLQQMFTHAHGN